MGDGGYLYDPEADYGHIHNPDVVPVEKLAATRCLVLLGEPGIGKTWTTKSQRDVLAQSARDGGGQTLWLDLKSFGDEDRLERKLSEEIAAWRKGEGLLALSLDSLDECRMRISNVTALLIEVFEQLPVERLYLRIACRTADWPNSFESDLKRLWKDDEQAVQAFELAPLRRGDVMEAATVNGVDAAAFVREVDRMSVVPLAIKPITLNFLLKQYQRSGSFPATQSELYLQGCRLLCEEPAEHRREAGLTGKLSADQRLAVASRIAAVTVFANRSAVWTNLEQGEELLEDVTPRALSEGSEVAQGRSFEVDRAAIEETLSSGLFSSRGPNRMGWAHQTYAEFLAARYVTEHGMTLPQAMSLIVHPKDPGKRLVPQLHEAAACLAGMRPDVFREIINVDPQVLLRSDVATTDEKDRAALAATLLRLFDEERLSDRDGSRALYRKLAHPGLAEQVRPYISDKTKGFLVRRVAADIAEACGLRELLDDLVTVALDTKDATRMRANAAHAVVRIGDAASKVKLKPLVEGTAGDDPDDELKGCGLHALWPEHIAATELFSYLTPLNNEKLFGAYKGFLLTLTDLTEHLKSEDLVPALNWAKSRPATASLFDPFNEVAAQIVVLSWEYLNAPGVLPVLAETLVALLAQGRDSILNARRTSTPRWQSLWSADDGRRRSLLSTLIPLISADEAFPVRALDERHGALVLTRDFPWLIERMLDEQEPAQQRKWLQVANVAIDRQDPAHFEALYDAVQKSELVRHQHGHVFEAIRLDSPKAEQQRSFHHEELAASADEVQLPNPPPHERVANLLTKFEAGDLNAWWLLNLEMTLAPDSTHYGNELESDLTTLPGWKNADENTQHRLVQAAERYILQQSSSTERWLGTNIFPDYAAYRALRLLGQQAPDTFAALPPTVWKKWASIVVAYPTTSGDGSEGPHRFLVGNAYSFASDEVLATLNILIDKENEREESSTLFTIRKMERCWDERLKSFLLAKAQSDSLKPSLVACLLNELIARGADEAKVYAESLLTVPPPTDEPARAKAQSAACALLGYATDGGWSRVWPAIQMDEAFGVEVVTFVGTLRDTYANVNCGQHLNDEQLADIYIWIVRHFPNGDKDYRPNGFVSFEEQVRDYRDRILEGLKQRGACDSIRHLVEELPERDWLKWVLLEAENIARRDTWVPPKPENIIKLGADRQRRFVENGNQLLEVITESLQRLEDKLQGETAAAFELWNEEAKRGKKRVWPKDENRFSDKVKTHLAEDLNQRGIILNREVVIRDSTGGAPGERVDIHVDAINLSSANETTDVVTAVIEVKGCWNPELSGAMETQLLNRYLNESGCNHGLYLVGWFNCKQWDAGDSRERQAPKTTLNAARTRFENQAATLSQGGKSVRAFIMNTALR